MMDDRGPPPRPGRAMVWRKEEVGIVEAQDLEVATSLAPEATLEPADLAANHHARTTVSL